MQQLVVNKCRVDLPVRSVLNWQMSHFTGRGRVAHWKPVTPWPRNLLGGGLFLMGRGRGLSFIFLDELSWDKFYKHHGRSQSVSSLLV